MTGLAAPGRRPALLAFVLLLAALVAVVAASTPWVVQRRPAGGRSLVDPARDFTAAQLAREDAFHHAIRPPAYLALALVLAVAAVLGLTPAGARLIERLARPFGTGWVWSVLVGALVLVLLGQLVSLPFSAWSEVVLRRYGLSTQDWAGWATDTAKSAGIATVLTVLPLLGFYAVLRAAPKTWWAWVAVAGAALVAVLSFGYPVLVEPVFNRFQPLPNGPLRTSLLQLAHADGVPVREVLVADASRRTTSLNAYVSGFGSTRRIVVYDTLLRRGSDEEVRLVVAHELGHAAHQDVLLATLVGALASAAAVCGGYLVLSWPALLRRAGVSGVGEAGSAALVLFLVALLGVLAMPAQSLVSRRIEARADVHSLRLTRDPAMFVTMQRALAVANLSDLDPNPVVYALFASHPTAPERIALARDWARLAEVAVPPDASR